MGVIVLCAAVSGIFFLLSKDTIGTECALGAAVLAPIVAFVAFVCFGGDGAGYSVAALAYATVLGYYYFTGKKVSKKGEEAVAPYVQICMNFMEDFAHFLPDFSRRVYFSYDFTKKCVEIKLWVNDAGYLKKVYDYGSAPNIPRAVWEKTRQEGCFGDYKPKHWACICAIEDGTDEHDSLYYIASLVFQNDPRVMKVLLEKAQTQFGENVKDIKRYNAGNDVTFWLEFSKR